MLVAALVTAAIGNGLGAGVFFAFSSFVMPALARVTPVVGVHAMQSINITVQRSMFLAESWSRRHCPRWCALGHSACRQGHSVRYVRLPRLLSDELVHARADGSYGKVMQTLQLIGIGEIRKAQSPMRNETELYNNL